MNNVPHMGGSNLYLLEAAIVKRITKSLYQDSQSLSGFELGIYYIFTAVYKQELFEVHTCNTLYFSTEILKM
jgi:hypothetical protein